MEEIRHGLAPETPVEVWFQDEMRVGQKNKLTYRWARRDRGLGPLTINAPNQPTCSAPCALNLEPAPRWFFPSATARPCSFISTRSPPRLLPGPHHHHPRSGRLARGKAAQGPSQHLAPAVATALTQLNSQENIWQFMRQNWLSNRVFKSFDDIVDHCCYAWNTLIDQP